MADEFLIGLDAVQAEIRQVRQIFSDAEQTAIMTVTARKAGAKAEKVALPRYPAASGKPLAVYYQRTSEAEKPYRLPKPFWK